MLGCELAVPMIVGAPVCRRCSSGFAVLAAVLLPLGAVPAQAEQMPGSVRQIAGLAARQARAARFLAGKSYAISYRTKGQQQTLENQSALTFVRDPELWGRIWLHYESMQYGNSTSRYEQIEAFDGRVTWRANLASAPADSNATPTPIHSGWVSHASEVAYYSRAVTGWFATLPGCQELRDRRFLDLLESPLVPFSIRHEDGSVVLSCRARGDAGTDEWWLRPAWAFCLHRYRNYQKGRIVASTEIEEATPVHPDLWYPTKIIHWIERGEGASSFRLHRQIDLTDLRALDHVDDEQFRPRFRPGTAVTVKQTGQTIRIGHSDDELQRILDEQAATLQAKADHERRAAWSTWGGVVVVVAGCWLLWRGGQRHRRTRRQRDPGPTRSATGPALPSSASPPARTSGLLLLVLAGSAPAQDAWWLEQAGLAPTDHCGVLAVALTARYLGASPSPTEVAGLLGCDPLRLQPVSLDRMQAALQSLGIRTSGFHRASLTDVLAACRREHAVAIVHAKTSADVGHFFLLAPAKEGAWVVNPAASMFAAPLTDPRIRRLAAMLTGGGLLVPNQRVRRGWRVLEEASWRVVSDIVANHQQPQRVAVDIACELPDGTPPPPLESFVRGCSCLAAVQATPTGIRVEVDRSKLPPAASEQTVLLRFAAPAGILERTLVLAFPGTTPPLLATPCLLPPQICVPRNGADVCTAVVTVVIPAGGMLPEIASGDAAEATAAHLHPVPGGIAIDYRVRWSLPRATIGFRVRAADGSEHVLQLPLRAD